MAKSQRTPIERFLGKVHQTDDGCWLWQGATIAPPPRDYGTFYADGRAWPAHRWIFAHVNGPIDSGLFVCHRCDTPRCVNPAHLFAGTPSQNMVDCASKGRLAAQLRPEQSNVIARREIMNQPKGERHPAARVRESDIPEIRRRVANGESTGKVSRSYGVSRETIRRIARGHNWGHVSAALQSTRPQEQP